MKMYTPHVPEELTTEIQSRLPVKSLMRFRCVSKSWNSLIFHPMLVKLHLQRSPKDTFIMLTVEPFQQEPRAVHYSVQSLLENPQSTVTENSDGHVFDINYTITGSCNGLICLQVIFHQSEFDSLCVRFWNSATRIISENSPRLQTCRFPDQSFVKLGFGYDDSSDSYKVVAVIWDSETLKTELRVHCMGENDWRKIASWSYYPNLEEANGQFVSGTLNWLAHLSKWSDYKTDQFEIFSFDLRRETHTYLLLPLGINESLVGYLGPTLGVLKGCLCLSHYYMDTHFAVWQMKEFGVQKSWTLLMKVGLEHLRIDFIPFHPPFVLCMSGNGDNLLLANNYESQGILYNRRDNRVEHFDFLFTKVLLHSCDYVQSLVLPYRN